MVLLSWSLLSPVVHIIASSRRSKPHLVPETSACRLDIADESSKHAGHVEHLGSAAGKGETHFTVEIVSPK